MNRLNHLLREGIKVSATNGIHPHNDADPTGVTQRHANSIPQEGYRVNTELTAPSAPCNPREGNNNDKLDENHVIHELPYTR